MKFEVVKGFFVSLHGICKIEEVPLRQTDTLLIEDGFIVYSIPLGQSAIATCQVGHLSTQDQFHEVSTECVSHNRSSYLSSGVKSSPRYTLLKKSHKGREQTALCT